MPRNIGKKRTRPQANQKLLKTLGPGLITGAADDDPSGIGTYSQVGAAFGFDMLWTMVLTYPLMTAIQRIAAEIGRVTGKGLAGNLRRFYPAWLLYTIVPLLFFANTVNLGADIGAMGTAMSMVLGGSATLYAVVLTAISLLFQIFMSYGRYVRYLKWLTMALFAYVASLLVLDIPWREVLHASFLPHLSGGAPYFAALVAVFGTTLSPYLFFWQAAQEVEDVRAVKQDRPLKRAPSQATAQLARIKIDTYVGMFFSNLVAFCIILTAALTLHAHGVTDITDATQAAGALRPLVGPFASIIFALGIVGTGMLAIPVLAGSAAYGIGEALSLPVGLQRKPHEAKAFYAALSIAMLVGLALTLMHVNPIRALFWSSVLNGVIAVPIMVVMMLMSANKKIMAGFSVTGGLRIFGWLATAIMGAASVGLFLTFR